MAKILRAILILGLGIVIGDVFLRPIGKGYMVIYVVTVETLAVITVIGWENTWLYIKKVWK